MSNTSLLSPMHNPMLTKKEILRLKKLQQKAHRSKLRLFVVEGKSSVFTFLKAGYKPQYLLATPSFIAENPELSEAYHSTLHSIDNDRLAQISSLKSTSPIMLITQQPTVSLPLPDPQHHVLLLDDIQNPGNLGTIIRIANWYGLHHIVASPTTVDCYNPKVVQASMGSLAHVTLHYAPLLPYIKEAKKRGIPVTGALLQGQNLHKTTLPKAGCLIIGNEAHGISKALIDEITLPITIPRFGESESLNAAIATAIICDHWRQNG